MFSAVWTWSRSRSRVTQLCMVGGGSGLGASITSGASPVSILPSSSTDPCLGNVFLDVDQISCILAAGATEIFHDSTIFTLTDNRVGLKVVLSLFNLSCLNNT